MTVHTMTFLSIQPCKHTYTILSDNLNPMTVPTAKQYQSSSHSNMCSGRKIHPPSSLLHMSIAAAALRALLHSLLRERVVYIPFAIVIVINGMIFCLLKVSFQFYRCLYFLPKPDVLNGLIEVLTHL